MKLNQEGVAHLQLILLVTALVGVVGLGAYRINQVNNKNQQYQDSQSGDEKVGEIEVKQEEKTEEVTVPEKQEETTPAPAPAPKSETKKSTGATTETKKDKVYLKMSQVSVSQDGSVLNVHSRLERAASGTCNFKLYREGFSKVYTSSKISNSQDCVGQLSLAGMPNYEGWSLYVWFDGDDGKTYAYQETVPVTLTNPN